MQNVETASIQSVKCKRNSFICENVDQLLVAETNSIVQSRVAIRILHKQQLSTAELHQDLSMPENIHTWTQASK